MTQKLREALRAKAAEAKSYEVYEHSMGTAKRRTLTRWAAAAVASLILAAVVWTGAPARLLSYDAPPADSPSGPPSLPALLGPPYGAPEAEGNPMGPASVLFGGPGWGGLNLLDGFNDGLAAIGASSDIYRRIHLDWNGGSAGDEVLLSPDGRLVALPWSMRRSGRPSSLDLSTGQVREFGSFTREEYATPRAWSPDGRTLAASVAVTQGRIALELIDVETGRRRRVAELDFDLQMRSLFRLAVAFRPDGRQLAYQVGEQITIVDTASLVQQAQFKVPREVLLAGKGAWTPDGTTIVTVEDGRTEWRLVPRSVADGAPVAASGWTFTEQVLLIRLLGWTPLGEPMIAAYDANPDLRHAERWSIDGITELVRVLALSGDGPRPLITPTGAVQSIDVADQAIASGLVRSGALTHRRLGPFLWDLGAKLAVLVLLVFLGRRLWVRWQEYRRRA